MGPEFLDLGDVLRIHEDQIARYGGLPGLRDVGLLLSAIAVPQATFGRKYLHEDLFAMAAAYLFHITRNHAFVDGNKRTGAAAALVFLDLNDVEVLAREDALAELVLAVARGAKTKAEIATFFRTQAR